MNFQGLLIGTVIFLAALGFMLLNDRLKKGKTHAPAKPKEHWLTLPLTIVVCLVLFTSVLMRRFGHALFPWWIIPLALAAVILAVFLFALRKVIWIYLKAIVAGGSFPAIIRTTEDGINHMKCPHCAARVEVTPGARDEQAFECENCGESGAWGTQMNFPQGNGNQPTRPHSPSLTTHDEPSRFDADCELPPEDVSRGQSSNQDTRIPDNPLNQTADEDQIEDLVQLTAEFRYRICWHGARKLLAARGIDPMQCIQCSCDQGSGVHRIYTDLVLPDGTDVHIEFREDCATREMIEITQWVEGEWRDSDCELAAKILAGHMPDFDERVLAFYEEHWRERDAPLPPCNREDDETESR